MYELQLYNQPTLYCMETINTETNKYIFLWSKKKNKIIINNIFGYYENQENYNTLFYIKLLFLENV